MSEEVQSVIRWTPSTTKEAADINEDLKCIPTAVSNIFVQAIVQKICAIIEPDFKKAIKLYELICLQMVQLKLIVKMYDINEFPATPKDLVPIYIQVKNFIVNLPSFLKNEPTTSTTLLVESLMQLLRAMVVPEPDKSSKIIKKIYSFLRQTDLINETYAMDEFEMVRNEYKKLMCQFVYIAQGGRFPLKIKLEWPLTSEFGFVSSRYLQEFVEMEKIAEGGCGQVFKARHKLDEVVYAIKKVKLKFAESNNFLESLAEIKIFASINHTNIVPYKTGWIEFLLNSRLPLISDGSSEATTTTPSSDATVPSEGESDSDVVVFEKESDDFVVLEISKTDSESNSQQICEKFSTDSNSCLPKLQIEWVLFVQMALCEMTLEEYLQKHSSTLPIKTVFDIFLQLVNALCYIHQRGIIHHDIKPSNVFISEETNGKLHVRLGDFGLACLSRDTHTDEVGFGTPGYAAPEQLNGKCTAKVSC